MTDNAGRVLITGGAGFLGSHLCDRYLDRGWAVECLDNEQSGRAVNVKHLLDHPRFTYRLTDVVQPANIDGSVDCVIHMASLASPPFYKRYPIDTLTVGSIGTMRMLDVATAKNARFVLASTSEVYGDPLESPQKETYWGNVNPIGPRSMYDESKRFGEALVMAYISENNVDAGIVRIFNTYGPRMRPDDGRVVTQFLGQILRDIPLTVHGDGKQTRSFCYVADLIDGIVRMADKRGEVGPINLGNPANEMSIMDLAVKLSRLFDKPFHQAPPMPSQDVDDPKQRCPDITRARQRLDWQPATSFEDGMQATYDYLAETSETAGT
jgi:dTDP-glucose 4,6-dehydratase